MVGTSKCLNPLTATDDSINNFQARITWNHWYFLCVICFVYCEWMNDDHYIALYWYCCTPKVLYNHVGGLSSTTISVQHPLGWCDGCHRTTAPVRSPHTSYRWRGERVIEPIKWMGIIRRPWLIRASGGNLASSTPGLHPYSLREVPWDDHRESGPRFNVSSERRMWILIVNKQNVIMKYGDTQRDSSPKNENSVINYSLSHCSRKCWPVRPSFF